jgi:hypothetical protein
MTTDQIREAQRMAREWKRKAQPLTNRHLLQTAAASMAIASAKQWMRRVDRCRARREAHNRQMRHAAHARKRAAARAVLVCRQCGSCSTPSGRPCTICSATCRSHGEGVTMDMEKVVEPERGREVVVGYGLFAVAHRLGQAAEEGGSGKFRHRPGAMKPRRRLAASEDGGAAMGGLTIRGRGRRLSGLG